MANVIPSFRWIESSPTAIQIDENEKVWHSGRVIDLLYLGNGRLLVGTATGGVWIANPDGTGYPISNDWSFPNVLCLAQGRGSDADIIFCGTRGGLYRNITNSINPSIWKACNLPNEVTDVYQIETFTTVHRIVIATNNGIWWAEHGSFTAIDIFFHWNLAQWRDLYGNIDNLTGAWSGLARTGENTLVAGTLNTSLKEEIIVSLLQTKDRFVPLIHGGFEGNNLILNRARLDGTGPFPIPESDFQKMNNFSISSCDSKPSFVNAVCFDSEGNVLHLLHSSDGGLNWAGMPDRLSGKPHPDSLNLRTYAKDAKAGGRLKYITTHPLIPHITAFSGNISFISDNGINWTPIAGDWTNLDGKGIYNGWESQTKHFHKDCHKVLFAPEPYAPDQIFIATDGGVFYAKDWHIPSTPAGWSSPGNFNSIHNRALRTLQFYSSSNMVYIGSICSTPDTRGIAVGGLQDAGP